jgi:sugar lactone lactonase YvrE
MEVLIPGEDWQQVGGTYGFTEGPAADREGNVYFTDIPNNKIYKIDADGQVTQFADDTGGANGLMFGPDGKLYACQGRRNCVVTYDKSGQTETVADGIEQCNDLCINHEGGIYVSEPPKGQVWYISPDHKKKVVTRGIAFPNGVILTPDQSQLVVADTKGVRLLAYQTKNDGNLDHREAFFDTQILPGQVDNGADGMTVDKEGRVYVTTRLGLQVLDPEGRVIGIINKPQNQWLANVVFGGKNLDTLYVTCGDHVYRRKTRTQGVLSWQAPVKPVAPKL